MDSRFLLKTDGAAALYEQYARNKPIIDYHNHLSVRDMAKNRRYETITEVWLEADPYKHRLMRICGVEEHFITGNAAPKEKFIKFCEIFPLLAGNPVYDWSRMELFQVFGISQIPTGETAQVLYDRLGEMLASAEYSNHGILKRFPIAYQSPVASLLDDLSDFGGKTAPSLRGDNLLDLTEELKADLRERTGQENSWRGICALLDRFHSAGCRFADHSLDWDFFHGDGAQREMLVKLGAEYARRGWTLLLHMGAKRRTSPRLARVAGPAGGYAAADSNFSAAAVCDLLGQMEEAGGLPDTVLFPLNMSDQAAFAILQGSFSQDGIASKVQLGPAWWWCDHAMGIRNTLQCIASFGAVSQFIGMTTDSRSILSMVRHDYFRRLLCSWVDEQNTCGEWALPPEVQGRIVERISCLNAENKIFR